MVVDGVDIQAELRKRLSVAEYEEYYLRCYHDYPYCAGECVFRQEPTQ